MLIPIGILAAAGAGAAGGGSYELIETALVGSGGQASVTFSNLGNYSSTYQHLQIRAIAMTTSSTRFYMQVNGITSSSYSWHRVSGNGSGVSSEGVSTQSAMRLMNNIQPASSSGAAIVVDLLDAYETSKFKTIRALSGSTGAANEVGLFSGLFQSTNAISSVTFGLGNSSLGETNLSQYSRFSLYGLRGV